MNQTLEAITTAGKPAKACDRVAWLFRRVTPNLHPLREMLQPCQPSRGPEEPSPASTRQAPCPPPSCRAPLQQAWPVSGTATLVDEGEIARRIHELPPLPRALSEALRVVRDDALSADDCVRAIEQDATLAVRVLRLANSPFYGARGRVSSIGDAVRLLGLRTVAGVVVAVSMRGVLAQWRDEDNLLQSYWRHAVATATTAREIAPAAGADPDEAFLAGLLHDLGRLVLAVFAPDPARLAREQSIAEDIDPREAEIRLVGCAHDDVGTAVARHWLLPEAIVAAIGWHHTPWTANEPETAQLVAVVHVADAIVHGLDLNGDPAEAVPPIDGAAWKVAQPPQGSMPRIAERIAAGLALLANNH